MIFVTLGTQKFQCNRLLKEVDRLLAENLIAEEVFAQIGHSDYRPRHYKYTDFLEKPEFDRQVRCCSLLITHSGAGTIIAGKQQEKPIIVFPRLQKYGEHVDDHQVEIAAAFEQRRMVLVCRENDDLAAVLARCADFEFDQYVSSRGVIIQSINDYLRSAVV